MVLRTGKRIYHFRKVVLFIILIGGCGNAGKKGDEVFRVIHNKQIVDNGAPSSGLTRFQLKQGRNTVFSYNKVTSENKNGTTVGRSESIVFQIPSGIDHFDYTGVSIDSSHAFYMANGTKLVQYPVAGGEIKGHRLDKNKWQVEMSVTVDTGGTAFSRHLRHVFLLIPEKLDKVSPTGISVKDHRR